MNKIFLKTAFTLIELIVAITLMAVVILGIFSISNVLNNNNQDYGQRFLVKSETQTTLNNILNNASLAVGSLALNDRAILIGAVGLGNLTDPVNNPNSFCIHQNPTGNVGGDQWLCYTFYGAGAATTATSGPNQIWSCTVSYPPGGGIGTRNAGSCNTATNPNITSAPTFLGSANSISSPNSPTFTNTQFSITIQNCLDNTAATCNGTVDNPGSTPGFSGDPAGNPEVQISGSVSAAQVSTG